MIEKIKARLPWLFGSHYKIERFGVLFGILCLMMVLDVGLIVRKHANDQKAQLGNQVMYTSAFRMSMSGAEASVENIHVSEDNTKCFILIKWKSMDRVVTDASKYKIFLTATTPDMKQEKLLSAPVGQLFMFGSTGYMGILLIDVNGFPSQILDMIIRSDNNFVNPNGVIPDAMGDASFTKHDQARVYFNPGGAWGETATCLEDMDMTAFGIFESILTNGREQEIRDEMDGLLLDMKNTIYAMEEYESRLDQQGIQLAERPYGIAGDEIVEDEDGNLELVTDVVLAKGYDFDWRGGSIRSGYIEDLVANSPYSNYEQFLYMKSQEVDTVNFDSHRTWYRKDGSEFVATGVGGTSVGIAQQNISRDIESLQNLWQTFYNLKYSYQVSLPAELIDLEVNAREMTQNYSVNTDGDLVRLY